MSRQYFYIVSLNHDEFTMFDCSSVTCTTRASSDALSGKVIVVTNNQSSTGTVLFSYKVSSVPSKEG